MKYLIIDHSDSAELYLIGVGDNIHFGKYDTIWRAVASAQGDSQERAGEPATIVIRSVEPTRNEIVSAIMNAVAEVVEDAGVESIGLDPEVYSTEDVLNVIWEIENAEGISAL